MTLAELEMCFEILLCHVAKSGVSEVSAGGDDYYWTIAAPQWRRIYENPEPSVGSFVDDEKELVKLLQDPSRASAVDLERLAHLLRVLSDALVAKDGGAA
jgi:hypothetical protein